MKKAFLGLGSNIGCKVGNIRRALASLKRCERIQTLRQASFYRTSPVGIVDQDWFVNTAVSVETDLGPESLLRLCLETERELGRERIERWGPRTIDIDLLLYGDENVVGEGIEVPHPRLVERAFALAPLRELEPELEIAGMRCADALEAIEGQEVERMEPVVAILGASQNPERYAHKAQRMLMANGHRVCPVSPRGGEVLGVPVLSSLQKCSSPVDTATLYIGSSRVGDVLDDLLAVMPRRVVFNPGTENQSVKDQLEEAGIETEAACTLVMLATSQW